MGGIGGVNGAGYGSENKEKTLWGNLWEYFPELPAQGKLKMENGALSGDTFRPDAAVVSFHHGFYITQSESESLHIMEISGMRPVKFLKNAGQGFFIHPYTIVFDPDPEFLIRALGTQLDFQVVF